MKKLLLIISFLIMFHVSKAQQWLYSNPNLYYNTGNVGIGTSTPSKALTINSSTTSDILFQVGGYNIAGLSTSSTDSYFYGATGKNLNITATLADVKFQTGNPSATSMIVKNNGFVGIGTTTPTEALDVNGNPAFGTITERISLGGSSLGFNRRVATGAIYDNTKFGYQFQHTGANGSTPDYLAWAVFNTTGNLVNATALTVTGSGQVGVNSSYIPSGFQFAVNGSIITTAVTVKLRTNWPDYVFKKSYKLPLLSELKDYIDKNHHLPDVPTAEEVSTQGQDLGRINSVLLKKVEELTLYLIEKDRQMEEQKKINRSLQKQIDHVVKKLKK
ncbi:hypothetical protein [Mucilaginibacter pedocola]|uniref:Peptidase S74 domain-containing protein n=1 Tax=Mucilaginibacter pedocola TaxID=1792845 RepID=A0A1S9PBG5_9SPHI|nr:hypothetical protein [Mucilaginibacter pedocola]OOQ58323.1 hypothetical protein BC343_11860 [Mucilaginibacter pedocola]